MTKIASRGRTLLAGLVTASVLGAAMAPTAAQAHGHHHGGFGLGAGIFGGALLLGALAAGSRPVYYERRCWTERRRAYDIDGNRYTRLVRFCR